MRVVLDTNVVMSGIFGSGSTGEILEIWSQGHFKLLLSLSVFDEYKEITKRLSEKYKFRSVFFLVRTLLNLEKNAYQTAMILMMLCFWN